MELKPAQLAAIGIALFATIVGVQVILEWSSNEDFRERFSQRDFSLLRPRLLREEGLQEETEQYTPADDEEE